MTRQECERKIMEYLSAIRLTMLEYHPDNDYLNMTIIMSRNGNDNGDWRCWDISANNDYTRADIEHQINVHGHVDIKDDLYWACVTEKEDREETEAAGYQGNLLPDGTFYVSMPEWKVVQYD